MALAGVASLVAWPACRPRDTKPAGAPVASSRELAGAAIAPVAIADAGRTPAAASDAGAALARSCGAALPAGGLAAAPDELLVEALVPSFDPKRKTVGFEAGPMSQNVFTDCRFHQVSIYVNADDPPAIALGAFAVTRQSFAGDRQAIWITIGHQRGLCESPVGFFAFVRAHDARIEVLGVTAWQRSCDNPGHARLLTFGPKETPIDALLVGDTSGSDEPGGSGGHIVYLPRGGDLVNAGVVETSYMESPMDPVEHGWAKSMGGAIRGDARGLIVDEAWTFEPHGIAGKTHTKTVKRLYTLEGDRLETPFHDPPTP